MSLTSFRGQWNLFILGLCYRHYAAARISHFAASVSKVEAIVQEALPPMNRPSQLKRALFAMVLSTTATAVAGTSNVCQVTSQDGLNSCKNGFQGDCWTAVGMGANISNSQSRQACILKAKSDYQSAITTCQDEFAGVQGDS